MRSLYLDAASREASRCCQRVLLFSAGRFPHSSSLMPPLWKSSSRTSSTSWKNTPNRKTDTCDKILAPAEGWVERSIPGSLGRSWLAARLVWQRPYFVVQKFVVKKHVAGMEPSLVPPQPGVSSLSQHCCWVQPGRRLFSPCTGLADSSPFSNKRYKGWLCSASPSPHSQPGCLGRTLVRGRSPTALVQAGWLHATSSSVSAQHQLSPRGAANPHGA